MDSDRILHELGFTVAKNAENRALVETIHYWNGPDGTIRWLWPATATRPLFLKFYHQAGWRAVLFTQVVRCIFWLRLQHWFFPSMQVTIDPAQSHPRFYGSSWAAFTGTPGPNRKMLVYESAHHNFYKIPLGENASHLLRHELAALTRVHSMPDRSFHVPDIHKRRTGEICLTDIQQQGLAVTGFTTSHERVLKELHQHTHAPAILQSLPVWEETHRRLQHLERLRDHRIPPALLRKIRMIMHAIPADLLVDTTLAHGDFTPWNMYQRPDGSLAIFDWELSRPAMPFGFDAFHFIIQNAILTQRTSWQSLEQILHETLFTPHGLLGQYAPATQRIYLALYLVINTVYYLGIYTQQHVWHRQVNWLLHTWSLALSAVGSTWISHRKLVLLDLADYLYPQRYAALKYTNHYPESLSENADLDLCLPEATYYQVRDFIAHHPLVSFRNIHRQSFMANELMLLQDGSVLSVDYIWKLKRKHLVMMSADDIMDSAGMTPFGIRTAGGAETARFIGLFYALNQAPVPDAYETYRTFLSPSLPLDRKLQLYYRRLTDHQSIIRHIKRLPANTGIRRWLGYFTYGIDVVKQFFHHQAPVITFSGVDGAGKSTIIEKLRTRIEKQLRKPVVILRHRPSVLPILSAYTKGKATAEREAAMTLPRQGKNKSTLSSLLRFAYYYIDYLIGQWYVWLRYTRRGHVILYDRYYFDFINDSRRSNIDLSPAFMRWCYRFVRKPDLNFFLYASPELIRSRKQELDTDTIRQLTEKYKRLFGELAQHHAGQYIAIENNDLAVTLDTIMGRVKRVAA